VVVVVVVLLLEPVVVAQEAGYQHMPQNQAPLRHISQELKNIVMRIS
jgi:hypothetical protein